MTSGISGCRLREKTQDRLAEFFVGGVTARSAAALARVNRKTAAYYLSSAPSDRPSAGFVDTEKRWFMKLEVGYGEADIWLGV
jgi:hypothetical protein